MLRRAWRRRVHRLAVATAATSCSAPQARMASADCLRRSMERSCWNGLVALRWPPTIEPIVALAQSLSAYGPHRQIAHKGLRSASPINTILTAGELLGTRTAVPTPPFISPHPLPPILGLFLHHIWQEDGLLPRHARPLS